MEYSQEKIAELFSVIEAGEDNNAFIAADKLADIGGEEIVNKLISLLSSSSYDTVHLAARSISKCKDNNLATEAVFELIKNGKEPFLKGILTDALSGFDCSEYFVEVFKLYLFGNFKVSAMAKEILDNEEFAITPRVIRKAEKHWKHYEHNIKLDEDFNQKKEETEAMFNTMKELFDGETVEEEGD